MATDVTTLYVYGLNVIESFVEYNGAGASAGSGSVRMRRMVLISFWTTSVAIVIGCEQATLRIFTTSISIVCAAPLRRRLPLSLLFIATNPTQGRRPRPQQAQWTILSCHRGRVQLVTETETGATLRQKKPSSTFPTFLVRAQDLRG